MEPEFWTVPSQPVTHVSTNPARPSLTSVIGRELVYSGRYDANRGPAGNTWLIYSYGFEEKTI